jgi:Flp pilus assembly protein TadD
VLSLVLLAGGCESTPTYSSPLEQDAAFARGRDEPPSAKTLYRLARVLSVQGRWSESSASLVACIERYPEFMPAYCDLAALHVTHRQYDEAAAILQRATEIVGNDPVVRNNLGMAMLLACRYEEALTAFESAVRVSPRDMRFRANLALVLGLVGRYEESLEVYGQLLNPHEAHYNLAVICQVRGDEARAQTEFQLARLRTPIGPDHVEHDDTFGGTADTSRVPDFPGG